MIILSLLTLILSCYFFFKTFKYKKYNVCLWKVYYFLLIVFSILTFVSDALIKDGGLDNFIILVCGFILILLLSKTHFLSHQKEKKRLPEPCCLLHIRNSSFPL